MIFKYKHLKLQKMNYLITKTSLSLEETNGGDFTQRERGENQRLRSLLVLEMAKNRENNDEEDEYQRRRSMFRRLSPSNLMIELTAAVDLNTGSSLVGRFNGREQFDSWAEEHPISSCNLKKKNII